MGCAGNPEVLTPNMDRLAAQGTRFDRTYANTPVCGPSRACLMTGKYPLNNRVIVNDLPLPIDQPSLGKSFKAAGYHTGYIGKWHLDGVPRDKWTPPGPRRHGFDFWAAYNCSHDYFRSEKYYSDSPAPVAVEGYEPTVQTDLALQFIEENKEREFCLFLSWGPPHDPYDRVPEKYKQRYDPQHITLRPNIKEIPPGPTSMAGDMDPRQTLANYYAAITALDEQLGRIMDHLDQSGLADNTILIYTSDHGDMLWSQGRMKKQQPWEESIHIPFIIRWQGHIPAGAVNESLFSIIDMAPTLYGLAGIERPAGFEGYDYSTLLINGEEGGPEAVLLMDIFSSDESLIQALPEWRGIRSRRYTYARMQDGTGWMLYDNIQDPYQLVNRINDPEFWNIKADMDLMLSELLRRAGDSFLSGKEHLRELGLVELWNERELALNPHRPNLI